MSRVKPSNSADSSSSTISRHALLGSLSREIGIAALACVMTYPVLREDHPDCYHVIEYNPRTIHAGIMARWSIGATAIRRLFAKGERATPRYSRWPPAGSSEVGNGTEVR